MVVAGAATAAAADSAEARQSVSLSVRGTPAEARPPVSLAALSASSGDAHSSATAPAPTRTLLSTLPRPIRDFTLTTESGKPLNLSDLSGTPLLVFFGFSHCPTLCPTALNQLRLLELEHAEALGNTRIVVISVDGDRDTPSMLHDWLKPISPTFLGLTGSPATVRGIAAQFSAAFFKGTPTESGDYLIEHNAQIFLLDAQGRMRATFFDAPVETIAKVTRDVRAE